MHFAALQYVRDRTIPADGNKHARGHTTWPRVVEFGGRDINGSPRGLIDTRDYLSIDIADGRGVDLVADVTKWNGKGEYDLVLCCEVLEHTDQVAEILASAGRALRPGGTLVLTAACDPRTPHSAVDGAELRDGEYYRNLDEPDLKVKWGDLVDVEWDRLAGDVRATIVKHEGRK